MRAARYIAHTALLAALVFSAAGARAAPREHTGPDSFLRWRAYTVEELTAQVESDPVLRQRLAKHFRVSEAEIVAYVRRLQVVTFESSGWRPVYGVTSAGRIYRSRDYFRAGGKAFGTADGEPVLKYACGNPLVAHLPPAAPEAAGPAPREAPAGAVGQAPQEAPPAVHAPQEFAAVMGMPIVVEIEGPASDPFVVPDERVLLAQAPQVSRFEVPGAVVSGPREAFPLWALAPGLFLLRHHDEEVIPGRVIPEPGTLVLLGGGAATLTLLRRRGRRRTAAGRKPSRQ